MPPTIEFITALFCQVDDQLAGLPKHPEAHLWPSEVVTLGVLHALKGVGNRPFYRWLTREYRPLFPRLPERTRRLCTAPRRRPIHPEARRGVVITNGVSCLQTNQYNSPCWPSCHGHTLPPSWLKACNPARNGGAHDHHGFYHGVVL